MAAAPEILYPMTNWSLTNFKYYSEKNEQLIEGSIPAIYSEVRDGVVILSIWYRYRITRDGIPMLWSAFTTQGTSVGDSSEGINSIPWNLNTAGIFEILENDVVDFEFKTVENRRLGDGISFQLTESTVVPLTVEIIAEDDIVVPTDRPTGIQVKRAQDEIKIMVPKNSIIIRDSSEFVGLNFYMSLTAGGGSSGYVQMNDTYVNSPDVSETVEVINVLEESKSATSSLEITTTSTSKALNEYYTFSFDRIVISRLIQEKKIPNIFLSDGVSLDYNQPYFFVVSSVVYDESVSQSVESFYSIEFESKFLEFRTGSQSLVLRTRSDVMRTMGKRLITDNPIINIISGSVIRDTLNPVSLEFEKFYVIQDFIFRILSLDSLLEFDDSNGDGLSDTIAENPGKRRLADALGIISESSLQQLIDEQFDRVASNYEISRNPSSPSRGTVTFYTEIEPSEDILIPDGATVSTEISPETGSSSIAFSVIGSYIIEAENSVHYYNPSKGRYEVEAEVEALIPGVFGNVPSGTITLVSGLNPSLRVINEGSTNFGENIESNRKLAERTKLAFISFDSGTEGGYHLKALSVPGVLQVRVEKAEDPLMMRDYDASSDKHIGGLVDIYIKGRRTLQETELLSFKYEHPQDFSGNIVSEVFSVINANGFELRSNNAKVSAESPIVEVMKVRNNTRRADYDIAGISIVGDGNSIILLDSILNKKIGLATRDVVEVEYKYRSSSIIKLPRQPVNSIVSVTDSNGVLISPSEYELVKTEDILKNGYSNIASDGIRFLFNSPSDFNQFISISGELHSMQPNIPSNLNYKGVEIDTAVVSNSEDSEDIYIKDVDYAISSGNEKDVTSITLLKGSRIRNGDVVSVAYTASQNFNITYTTNGLVEAVRSKVAPMKHACADVIVKEAVGNKVDFSFMVIRQPGVNKSRLKSRIQTRIAYKVRSLSMGETLSISSMLNIVKAVDGVKEVVFPFTRMMKRSGSFIPLDDLGSVSFQVYNRTSAIGVTSYISISSVLSYKTIENGGPSNLFRSVYENNRSLDLVGNPADVSKGYGRAYIQEDGRIIVSTLDGTLPHNKKYSVSYYIEYGTDDIVSDIETSEIEYLEVDSLSVRDIEIIDDRIVKRGL